MATLYITEFSGLASQPNDQAQVVYGRANIEQALAIGGVSAPSVATKATTTIVRLHADSICSFKIGPPGVVATTASARMVAGQTEYFGVNPGDVVAAIVNV